MPVILDDSDFAGEKRYVLWNPTRTPRHRFARPPWHCHPERPPVKDRHFALPRAALPLARLLGANAGSSLEGIQNDRIDCLPSSALYGAPVRGTLNRTRTTTIV
jgi:hypothetical protein